MIFLIALTCHIVANYYVHSKELTSVIQTDKGPVQGEILKSIRKSVAFSSFRGIRYGKPPTGYSRFKPPEEADLWLEIFNATADGRSCPQVNPVEEDIYIDEDCLNLNVYSPKIDFNSSNEKLYSVMVWIYGGAFKNGNTKMSIYGPDFLIENEVVVVLMNYRLGVLGFLSLNLPGATGNAGLKDQQLALKWVQKNIAGFGGNPRSVTIFGQSAGAAAVDYHILADGSEGLFHRSISMSGSPLCYWAFSLKSQAEERAFYVGSLLGINTNNREELLGRLYNISASDLIMAAEKISIVDAPFKPTLEDPKTAGSEAFLSECSVNKYKAGNFSQVPSIHGFMASEALEFLEDLAEAKDGINRAIDQMQQISDDNSVNIMLHSYHIILNAVNSLDDLTNDTFNNLDTILSDVGFISGIDMKQKFLTHYGRGPVYYYRNSFAPYPSVHRFLNGINRNGAAHADDVDFCWYSSIVNFPTDPKDPFVIMQDRISRMWTNFAKYSNPTPVGMTDPLLDILWPASGLESTYLEINDELSVGRNPIDSITRLTENIMEPFLSKINGC